MTKVLMIQGTMSNVGKSLLVAGLCRLFRQEGLRTAPFKSQNMALNSFVTKDGLEMGRAQVVQAEAAGIDPCVCMNPILLKPTGDDGSQVIVNGRPIGNMKAREYFSYKTELIPVIREAFQHLAQEADLILVEGAGSPAEINLKENDIVNMGMADLVDAPVLLVGDIDRGGVFAQLLGTLQLLEKHERERVRGLIINKFRGDATLLDPGIAMLEEKGGVPVVGTVPYVDLKIEEEDSLSERLTAGDVRTIDLVVIRLPRMSNFSDFDVFLQSEEVSVRFVEKVTEAGRPDLLILPGTKNTIADRRWLAETGWEKTILSLHRGGTPVFGICGGYQMLGDLIEDPDQVEDGGNIAGLALLPQHTVLKKDKITEQKTEKIGNIEGIFAGLTGAQAFGYEIHMGKTRWSEDGNRPVPLLVSASGDGGDVYGTYLHGIFDRGKIAGTIITALAQRKGTVLQKSAFQDRSVCREQEYDKLAQVLREHLDMEMIRDIIREAHLR